MVQRLRSKQFATYVMEDAYKTIDEYCEKTGTKKYELIESIAFKIKEKEARNS